MFSASIYKILSCYLNQFHKDFGEILLSPFFREVKTLVQGRKTVTNDLNINYNFKILISSGLSW